MNQCKYCKREFEPDKWHPNQKTCSPKCHYELYKPIKYQNNKRYQESDRGKKIIQRYSKTDRFKQIKRKSDLNYSKSPEGKLTHKKTNDKYKTTIKGQIRNKFTQIKSLEKIRGATSNYSIEEWYLKLYKTQGFCWKCDGWFGLSGLTTDHNMALSTVEDYCYTIDDIQFICLGCNDKKFTRMDYFIHEGQKVYLE